MAYLNQEGKLKKPEKNKKKWAIILLNLKQELWEKNSWKPKNIEWSEPLWALFIPCFLDSEISHEPSPYELGDWAVIPFNLYFQPGRWVLLILQNK